MTYQETLEFLFSQLPQFQKVGGKAYKASLDNIKTLCERLGNPQDKIKTIHVAGTNGKGSVCHMLASTFSEAGYKAGLFTSPHIIDFRERIRVNGEMISEQEVIEFVVSNQSLCEDISPSFFEWSTALAFYYFAQQEVDVAIIETGLGGRLDSTNIIHPLVSIITSIGIDHVAYLGDRLEDIAFEKGGIIKPHTPFVLGPDNELVLKQLKGIAQERKAPFYEAKIETDQPGCSLPGLFQSKNIASTLTALNLLLESYPNLSVEHIHNGLKNIQKNTTLRGRWETLQTSPKVIADIGHNEHALTALMEQLKQEKYHQLHIVWGMMKDKEVRKVVQLLPSSATYHICTPKIARALPTNELEQQFPDNANTSSYSSCNEAFKTALNQANEEDLIYVGGSTFVVSEIISDFFQ